MFPFNNKSERVFAALLRYPRFLILLCLAVFLASSMALPRIVKDTTIEAFIREDDPVRLYRDQVRETFGLDDPMVIAITSETDTGVFTPATLDLIIRLTEAVADVPGIDPDAITSLATENYIEGTEDGLLVGPLLEQQPASQEDADAVRQAALGFPLYAGSLVGRDGRTTVIAAELLEDADASLVYLALQELVTSFPDRGQAQLHVAGEGAVSGYLAYYIDADARRLNPLAGLIITLILVLAFRTVRGSVLPNLLVLGAVGSSLGMMAWLGVPFYVITNGLPVLLIAIAVADGIHILGSYYELQEEFPNQDNQVIVVRAMGEMWRPVTLTSLTDVAGFMAIFAASAMPPMKYFGLFAAYGVTVALMFSLLLVPAVLILLKKKPSRAYVAKTGFDPVGRTMASLGRLVWSRPGVVLAVTGLVVVLGVIGATRLVVNDERIDSFAKSEPLTQADAVINTSTDGSHYIDIVVETGQEEGLFEPHVLARMEALQSYALSLAHVNGAVSLVDYVKQMNKEFNEGSSEMWRIPENANMVAQYFLLYTASGSPTDFEDVADGAYQQGNMRLRMDTQNYAVIDQTVNDLEAYIGRTFDEGELNATVSGAVKLHQHWLGMLKNNHFWSVALSLMVIGLVASAVFRSFAAGFLALLPVSVSLLFIYAVMGYFEMPLAVGTSMFAAISLGAGIDFAIHSIDRFLLLIRDRGYGLERAFSSFYATTGRALFYSFSCLLLGFGVLTTSSVVTLIRFGTLMGVSAAASFAASMTLLPALIKLWQPAFLGLESEKENASAVGLPTPEPSL